MRKAAATLLTFALTVACEEVPPFATGPHNVWLDGSPLSFDRQNLPAVTMDDRIYLPGGLGRPFGGRVTLRDVAVYDPEANAWRPGTPMPQPRHSAGAAVASGRLYVVGGFTRMGKASGDVFVYDATTDAWSDGVPVPTAGGAGAVVAVGGFVYAVGGYDPDSGSLDRNERFDPASGAWQSRARMPTPRNRFAAAVADGKIYTFGGTQDSVDGRPGDVTLAVVEVYEPDQNRWYDGGRMPMPLRGAAAVTQGLYVYLFGGVRTDTAGDLPEQIWRYDPGTDEWEPVPTGMPTPRHGMAAVVHEGRIFLIGGESGAGYNPSRLNEVYIP